MLSFRPRRWPAHLALAFGAGVFLGLRVPPHPLWGAGIALCLIWAALTRRNGKSLYLPCMGLAVMLGLLRCGFAAHPVLPPEGAYAVSGTVQGEAARRETDGRIAVYLKDVALAGESAAYRAYWTYWPDGEDAPLPQDGQRVSFSGRIYHPMAQSNPHGFDFRLFLLQKGVTLGVTGANNLTVTPGSPGVLTHLRGSLRERLDVLLGAHGPLAAALLLGDKSGLPDEVAESFRTAGAAHVLAVSGLHVMILFSCIVLALRRFSPSQAAVLAVSAALLLLYGLLAGMQASILRAGLLMLYVQSGRIVRRRADPLTALALAFAVILAFRPLELFAAGFQMSFGAVLGLILLGDRAGQMTRRIRRPALRHVAEAYTGALCGATGAALPVAWYYHRLSPVGLLISPVLVAAVTLLLPLLLFCLALSFVWMPLAWLPARAAGLLCGALTRAVQWSASLPFAAFRVPRLPWYAQAAIVLALILCTRYVRLSVKKRVLTAGAVLAVSVGVLLLTRNTAVRYLQFSEGNADAAVIEDGGETIVIDAAEYGGDLADYLLSEGRGIDHLILTHLHADHALGLQDLLRRGVPIGALYLSGEATVTPVSDACMQVIGQAQSAGIDIRTLSAGDSLATDRVHIDVLWPEAGGANPLADANDFALALRIDLDGVTMLHMSDISGAYELRAAAPAQVLRVAHHGSASGTGARFLDAVAPDIALISARRASAAVLQRLADAGVTVYDTDSGGALTLTARDGQATLQCYKK